MNYQLVVSRGTKLSTNIYFRGCEIFIGEMRTQADLIQIGKIEYDIILGIDWLSTYWALVDCHQKKIIFKMERIPECV